VVKDAAEPLYRRLLILRCQAGDEEALGELIARYSPGLRLFLAKLSGQAADDLLQDTWFDVYRKINGLRNPEAFVTWLYRIARDRAYRELRRRNVASTSIDESEIDDLAAEENEFGPEDAEAVRAALDEIPAEQREVLLLRFIEQMSYEQIAEVIARPIGTVRSRIHHGKLALGAKLRVRIHRKEMPS
jgi:RNA polymerase sigma-70 factor, ECF subfamily